MTAGAEGACDRLERYHALFACMGVALEHLGSAFLSVMWQYLILRMSSGVYLLDIIVQAFLFATCLKPILHKSSSVCFLDTLRLSLSLCHMPMADTVHVVMYTK
jgi:hypothetical protein